MPELITVGETMVSLSPLPLIPLRYSNKLSIHIAGAESNVAIGVSKLLHSSGFITKIGNDEMGRIILNQIRSEGVDCSGIVIDNRYNTGVMFKEPGTKDTKIFYYRENSAASHLTPSDINLNVLADSKILHLTGITPILSESCMNTVEYLFEMAKKCNVKVSFDPNIRKKLWKGINYKKIIKDFVIRSDIVEMGIDEAKLIFDTDDCSKIITTLNKNNPEMYIALKNGDKGCIVAYHEKVMKIEPFKCNPVDAVGAGDAFNAGFLSGILSGLNIEDCGKIGNICGALATETTGDTEGQPLYSELKDILESKETIYR